MGNLSKQERRELRRQRRKDRKAMERGGQGKSNRNKNIRIVVLASMLVAAVGYLFMMISSAPGNFDNFTKCLTEKGMVVYGNDWCRYTQEQMSAFGSSTGYLNYIKCDENEGLCRRKGVQITPTWEIDGKAYSGVQTFETLSEVSGCGL